jgi:hypothetical protein
MKTLNVAMYLFLGIAVVALLIKIYIYYTNPNPPVSPVACTIDAMQCPDGSYVGRSGSNCEFVCPEVVPIGVDVQVYLDSKADLIKITSPAPMANVSSPLTLSGQARGQWFFEASAPVVLTNWDGEIIAESYVTADGEWMTTEYVPFTGEINFISPYKAGDPDFMKRGSLIFQKDNPSGLLENDNALEIPVLFAQ